MALPQHHVWPGTPMGATLAGTGATIRLWAPRARAVHVCYHGHWAPVEDNRLSRGPAGHWTGFVDGLRDGSQYKLWVVGDGSTGFKRDPRARELTPDPVPLANGIVRDPGSYPWHDAGFRPPAFHELVIYQLHVGSMSVTPGHDVGTFLDVLGRLDHLLALGVNALQLLPVAEFPTSTSLGYNGTDLYSPEQRYAVQDPAALESARDLVNRYLTRGGRSGLTTGQLQGGANQLKALVDVCHLHGLAVLVDVVYNHAGPGFDDESLYFLDRAPAGDNNNSLYFTDQGWVGGLVFAYWNGDVRQFLIDNAVLLATEFHVDGFRYDAMDVAVHQSGDGWGFCQDLTSTVRFVKPEAVQVAEYWPVDPRAVRSTLEQGAGFDACWDDGLRDAVRAAVAQASAGRDAAVDMDRVARNLRRPGGMRDAWRSVRYIESHDEVRPDRGPRVPVLADSSDPRSWYARSRSRVATGLLLTAPGIPMLFMGQEMLEATPWTDDVNRAGNVLSWARLDSGDEVVTDFLVFVQELLRIRRDHPGLRGEGINVFHVHQDGRVIAFHRWVEGAGDDVVVLASLSETTRTGYRIGMPRPGRWAEVFNSDVYDNWINPHVAGNAGSVWADGAGMHGMPAAATVTIPPNAIVLFTAA
ncbi:1,4-alpha-glucan branching enzyme [Blastococcus sp. DSM 46786]|uniref:alpha amylase C-terminal domain-containing protein n=1 Tax=Blastococcus sp. DSM 46786 TaxID=1798227 RepID=UPI0008B574F3|nr:alpha amylase C-terminal domain-containing protein [Blastococcus sp. DSM 46786]SEK59085.1 1,4-alpha-glucan branching enzyme [Blastococcus sp. DSM 46786]